MAEEYEWVYQSGKGFEKTPLEALKLKKGEVLIRPKFVGICGTDLYLIRSGLSGLRLGHEWVGEIIGVSPGMAGFRVGDLATGTGHFSCSRCGACKRGESNLCESALHFSSDKMGALRSVFKAPKTQILKLKGPLHQDMVLHEILAVGEEACRLLKKSLRDSKPKRVLVFGGGPIGIATALALKTHGYPCLIIEKQPARVSRARRLKLPAMTLSEALLSEEMRSAFSVLIDTTNDYSGDLGAFRLLPHFACKRFTALVVGKYTQPQAIPSRYNSMAARLIWMRGVSNRTMKASIKKWAPRLNEIGSKLISHTFDGNECAAAFEQAFDKDTSLKVVVEIKSPGRTKT